MHQVLLKVREIHFLNEKSFPLGYVERSNPRCIANLWIHTVTKSQMRTWTHDWCNNPTWRPKINLRLNVILKLKIYRISDQGDFQKLPMHFVRHVCEYWSRQNYILICVKRSCKVNIKYAFMLIFPVLFYSNAKVRVPWIKSCFMQTPLFPVLLISDNQADLSFNTSK